jgi:hypothetical protein
MMQALMARYHGHPYDTMDLLPYNVLDPIKKTPLENLWAMGHNRNELVRAALAAVGCCCLRGCTTVADSDQCTALSPCLLKVMGVLLILLASAAAAATILIGALPTVNELGPCQLFGRFALPPGAAPQPLPDLKDNVNAAHVCIVLSLCMRAALQPPELHPYNFPELLLLPVSPLTEHDHQIRMEALLSRNLEAALTNTRKPYMLEPTAGGQQYNALVVVGAFG